MTTTGDGRSHCTWPHTFWFKPVSAFGLLDLTTFISSAPGLAMPSTLAPDRLGVGSRRIPSREIQPPEGEVTLSQELRTVGLLRPHVLVGYRWSYIGLCPGCKSSHNRNIRSFVSQPPLIRTCTSNASGSSRCGAVPHTIHWLAVTRWEVRCPRRGSDVWSTTRHPLRSTGSGRARSPASTLLWGTPTPCRPSRRTSFPSLGDTIVSSPVRPHSSGLSCGSSWSWYTGLQPAIDDGDGKVSHVPVKPVRSFAMFLRPRCDQARWWVQVSLMPGAAPAGVQDEGSRQGNFGAQSHSV